MKISALTAASLAALASGVVMAASEGGDTWSAVQLVQSSNYSSLQAAPRPWAEDSAWVASEGGDTWSSLQALRETTVRQGSIAQRPAGTDTRYAGVVGGSEGGDTWSRFLPQRQGQPIASPGMASGGSDAPSYGHLPLGE